MSDSPPMVELRPTSLVILPGLSWEEWEGAWQSLDQTSRSIPWLIGDALVYAQDSFGEQWSQAVDAQYADQYGRYLRVSRLIPPAERRENFSWSAHREAAALDATERAEIFDLGEANGWRSREIRDEVQRRKAERQARTAYPSNGAGEPPAEAGSTWNWPPEGEDTGAEPAEASQDPLERVEPPDAPEAAPEPFRAPAPASGDEADYIRALIAAIRRLGPDLSKDWRLDGLLVDRGESTVKLAKGNQLAIGVGASLPAALIEASLSALLSDLGAE